MSLRTLWKGVLHLGALRIPVRLYAAASDHSVHFRLLHRQDRVPVRQRMVNPEAEEEVSAENMRRGAEIEPGVFVLLNDEELEELTPESSRDIEVGQFVPRSAVEHIWYDRPYFLAPDGEPVAYWALVQLLRQRQVEGIAHWVMRQKEYVGSLYAQGESLVLVTLRFAEEVVAPDEIDVSFKQKPDPNEVRMANQLLGMLESDFEPNEYHDDFHDSLLELIEKKARGDKVKVPKVKARPRESSLSEALKESLAHAKK